jgi:hypothetical protein
MASYLQTLRSSDHYILYQYHQHDLTPLLKILSFIRVNSKYHSNHNPFLSIVNAYAFSTISNKNFHGARASQILTHGKVERTYAHGVSANKVGFDALAHH